MSYRYALIAGLSFCALSTLGCATQTTTEDKTSIETREQTSVEISTEVDHDSGFNAAPVDATSQPVTTQSGKVTVVQLYDTPIDQDITLLGDPNNTQPAPSSQQAKYKEFTNADGTVVEIESDTVAHLYDATTADTTTDTSDARTTDDTTETSNTLTDNNSDATQTAEAQASRFTYFWGDEEVKRWGKITETSHRATVFIQPKMHLMICLPTFEDPDVVWANPEFLYNRQTLATGGFYDMKPIENERIPSIIPLHQVGKNHLVSYTNKKDNTVFNLRSLTLLRIHNPGVVRLRMRAVHPDKPLQTLRQYEIVLVIQEPDQQVAINSEQNK